VTPPATPSSTIEEQAPQTQKPQRGLQLLSESLPQRPTATSTGGSKDDSSDDIIFSEILLISESLKAAEAHRQKLLSYGLRIKQRKHLAALDMVLSRFRVPAEQDPQQLMQQLQEQQPELTLEFNRRYYLLGNQSSNAKQFARQHTGLTQHSGKGVTLAMLDAKVDTQHPALSHARIENHDVTGKNTPASQHGTAIASLLVGTQLVQGALPQARLIAVNIFHPGADERLHTQSHWWLEGLNQVMSSASKPHAINMSFGGSYSTVIASVLSRLAAQHVRLAAAAGNSGADSEVYFPASHPQVVAVTAVDSRNKRYTQAPRKLTEPAVAAPGVDIWAADRGGKGFYATGTSFACPWVTAMLALGKQQQHSLTETLARAKDLGPAGFDSDFGTGLIYYP
jgi:subtilisin family serine protease